MTERIVADVWDKPDPFRVFRILEPVKKPWWMAAGLAIDLFVGHETRDHHDADVAIDRRDASAFRQTLVDWEIGVAVGWDGLAGRARRILRMWDGGTLLPNDAQALWCRPAGQDLFVFELLLNRIDGDLWHFKREDTVTLPVDRFGLVTQDGIPYLAPQVVLLHKATSTAFDEQDCQDFKTALPLMTRAQKAWLKDALSRFDNRHPWLPSL